MEEDSEQTSNEATLSYLDYLANLDSEQVREEVAKRSAATKEHTRKLLHFVEISGSFSSTVAKEKPSDETKLEGEENKGIHVVTHTEKTISLACCKRTTQPIWAFAIWPKFYKNLCYQPSLFYYF